MKQSQLLAGLLFQVTLRLFLQHDSLGVCPWPSFALPFGKTCLENYLPGPITVTFPNQDHYACSEIPGLSNRLVCRFQEHHHKFPPSAPGLFDCVLYLIAFACHLSPIAFSRSVLGLPPCPALKVRYSTGRSNWGQLATSRDRMHTKTT